MPLKVYTWTPNILLFKDLNKEIIIGNLKKGGRLFGVQVGLGIHVSDIRAFKFTLCL